MKKKLRICLVASAGGHLTQLLKLEDSWRGHQCYYIVTSELVRQELEKKGHVYVVCESNRSRPFKVLKVFFRCMMIILKIRPHIVISTGAAAGCIVCFLGKLTGAKIVWVDSITNVEKLSLSGRMVRHVADEFFVQWPNLKEKYRNTKYVGSLI